MGAQNIERAGWDRPYLLLATLVSALPVQPTNAWSSAELRALFGRGTGPTGASERHGGTGAAGCARTACGLEPGIAALVRNGLGENGCRERRFELTCSRAHTPSQASAR